MGGGPQVGMDEGGKAADEVLIVHGVVMLGVGVVGALGGGGGGGGGGGRSSRRRRETGK